LGEYPGNIQVALRTDWVSLFKKRWEVAFSPLFFGLILCKTEFLKEMYSKLLNYGIRIAMIIVGLLMAVGFFTAPGRDETLMRMLGIVLILFGVYRIAMYHNAQKRRYDDDGNPR
jgi:hypothetical protein